MTTQNILHLSIRYIIKNLESRFYKALFAVFLFYTTFYFVKKIHRIYNLVVVINKNHRCASFLLCDPNTDITLYSLFIHLFIFVTIINDKIVLHCYKICLDIVVLYT